MPLAFLGNFAVPKTIDSGATNGTLTAILVDVALLAVFAVQHSGMARPAFKQWWTRIIPRPAERSTYVMITSLLLFLLYWQWRPLPGVVWAAEAAVLRAVIVGLFWLGWMVVLVSTFLIDHFELFGLKQTWYCFSGREAPSAAFRMPLLYGYVRHPIMLGFIIAFWAAPTMTAGHLLFAAVTTAYIPIAIQFEERDLVRAHGESYVRYRRQTPMLLPLPKRPRGE